MKKYLITLALCVLALTASAQVFTAEQIERYAKDKYGDNWTEAAGNLSKEVALDNKNRLNYQEVIACAGQSKAEIFKKAIEWFNRAFKSKDTHGVIREQNAEQGLDHYPGLYREHRPTECRSQPLSGGYDAVCPCGREGGEGKGERLYGQLRSDREIGRRMDKCHRQCARRGCYR